MQLDSHSSARSVDDVLITAELARRPARAPDSARESRVLAELARTLGDEPDRLLPAVVDRARELCRADSAGVSVLHSEPGPGMMRMEAVSGPLAVRLGHTVPADASPSGIVIARGEPQLFLNPGRFFTPARVVLPEVHEALFVPFSGGGVHGALWVLGHRPEVQFSSEDVRVLTSLAAFAGAGCHLLQRTRSAAGMREEHSRATTHIEAAAAGREETERTSAALLARELEDTKHLQRVSSLFVQAENADALYEQILEAAITLLQADAGCLQMLDLEANQLVLLGARGLAEATVSFLSQMPCEAGSVCAKVLHEGVRVIAPDLDHAALPAGDLEHYRRSGVRSAQSTPLFARDGRPVGIISTYWHQPHHPGERELRLLDLLARQAADMLERNRSERALSASRAFLQRALSIETVGVLFFDLNGRIRDANPAFARMSGYTREELIQCDDWSILTAPEFLPGTRAVARELAERGETTPYEKQFIRKDGSRWWALLAPSRLSGAGTESRCVEFVLDITEQKRIREALQESEERFRTLADAVPQVIWTNGPDGAANYFNQRWYDFTALTPADSIGPGWQAVVHPEDALASTQKWRAALAGGELFDCEYRLRGADGAYRWFIARNVPLRNSAGDITGWFGTATDIQELKEAQAVARKREEQYRRAQERLRLIVESSLEHAIISLDLDRRITMWNSGAERILGFSRDEILHQSADLIFTPEDRTAGVPGREAQSALDRGRAVDERWHQRKDGSRFWGSGVMLPMFEPPGGVPTGFIKILRDETERRTAQQALEASRQDLLAALAETERARANAERATRAKDEFLAALSHELRTPLNPVLLLASEAAENPSLSPAIRDSFSTIRNNVQLEARLIDDLLDLTRISRGKLLLERQPTDAQAVLRQTAEIIRPDAAQKNIRLEVELCAPLPVLDADPVRLAQIFWNVLKNAVKFTPEGGRIHVRSDNSPAGDHLVVSVADSGIGMTAAEINRVFDAFAQGDHAEDGRSHRFGGLGLGLSISHMLAEHHGGTIRAMSGGRNQGSTFEIDLPLHAPSEPAAAAAARTVTTAAVGGTAPDRPRPGERILLVEDHDVTRRALATLLRHRGFEVESAGTAAEARRVAAGWHPTLLLSDIGLPDGDGCKLMQELRGQHPLRGIALTGYGTDEDLARSRRAGFDAHLTKPISAQALDRALAVVRCERAVGSV